MHRGNDAPFIVSSKFEEKFRTRVREVLLKLKTIYSDLESAPPQLRAELSIQFSGLQIHRNDLEKGLDYLTLESGEVEKVLIFGRIPAARRKEIISEVFKEIGSGQKDEKE